MIYDGDPFRRRPRKSTVKSKRWERCVWMMTKVAEWASEHAQITNIGLSDGYGEKAILTAVQFGYDRHGSQGYLGNIS